MTASSPAKINIVFLKRWMTAILTVTKTDTLLRLQLEGEVSRLPLNNRMPKGLIIKKFSSRVEISTRYTELKKIAII